MSNEGGFGKAMAHALGQEVRGVRKDEALGEFRMPSVGDTIRLVKREVQEGKASAVPSGDVIEGELMQEIRLGEQLRHSNGQTSAIQGMRIEGNKIILETKTSIYELSRA